MLIDNQQMIQIEVMMRLTAYERTLKQGRKWGIGFDVKRTLRDVCNAILEGNETRMVRVNSKKGIHKGNNIHSYRFMIFGCYRE